MEKYEYYAPRLSLFGYGCREGLKTAIQEAGYQKGLVVTDAGLVKLGVVAKVTDVLDEAGIEYLLFDQVKPNPTIANAEAGLEMLRQNGCDFLLSIGGGSAHDCAKAIGIVATNGGKVQDYRGRDRSRVPSLPIIAVNTTAGTGSECTRAYVMVEEATGEKYGNRDKNALVAIAVNDHELMMGLPAALTAGTGMDALTHAVECCTSKSGFLLASELALSAIRLVFAHLKSAVATSDEKSREAMATAQYLAGLAFGNGGVGLVHSMSHQLSAVYDLPHGLCNAILLPVVMRFNRSNAKAERQYGEVAEVIFPLDCAGKSDAERCDILIEKIERLSETIGTRVALGTLGVRREDVVLLAEKTLQDGSLPNNPVQPSAAEIEELFKSII